MRKSSIKENWALSPEEMLDFKSNTQLLTDEALNIPMLVQQVQILAKKHVESMNMLGEQALSQIALRRRVAHMEFENAQEICNLKDVNLQNVRLLLKETLKQPPPLQIQDRYLKSIMAQIREVNSEERRLLLIDIYQLMSSQDNNWAEFMHKQASNIKAESEDDDLDRAEQPPITNWAVNPTWHQP